MSDRNYTTGFSVDQSPEEVFRGINNVRGWWSEEIEGRTDMLGAEFRYHYQDVHRCTFRITEFVPDKRVVWHVLDNYFNFTRDKTEWTGTDLIFDIARKGDKTEVSFTHVGLVPAYECYGVCSDAWGSYITGSLRDLIATGTGRPNPIEDVVNRARRMSGENYTAAFTVDRSPDEVYAAVNNVRGWWSEEIEGTTDALGAEFVFHYEELHRTTQRITELVPGRKVVWHVTDSQINFVTDTSEWEGTDIVFEIAGKGDRTELRFTHVGLVPAIECYGECSQGWSYYLDSLRNLIETGKGNPAKAGE